jgi:hypothetical protein
MAAREMMSPPRGRPAPGPQVSRWPLWPTGLPSTSRAQQLEGTGAKVSPGVLGIRLLAKEWRGTQSHLWTQPRPARAGVQGAVVALVALVALRPRSTGAALAGQGGGGEGTPWPGKRLWQVGLGPRAAGGGSWKVRARLEEDGTWAGGRPPSPLRPEHPPRCVYMSHTVPQGPGLPGPAVLWLFSSDVNKQLLEKGWQGLSFSVQGQEAQRGK